MPEGTPPRSLTGTLTFSPASGVAVGPDLVSPGEVLDQRFELIRIIARGGMGVVAEAEDRTLGARVALKFISPALAGDPAARERFRREILLARRITHRNVCRIFELFSLQRGGQPLLFLTMELLEGETLTERLARGRLDPERALPLLRQMVDALEAAHSQGVVHRDFKSSNVLLVPDGASERLVVTDFGIARALEKDRTRDPAMTGEALLGSPPYMAPEQVLGAPITPATDIYALGVVLFEMLSGQLPFEAGTPMATALLRVHQAAPRLASRRPDLDPKWDAVVATCLAREPVFRYATVADVLRALEGKPGQSGSMPALSETLPAEVTPFVGRLAEVAAAAALLRRSGVRLVTLTGPGGTGKTRLSIEVARSLRDEFTDGLTFVSLSDVTEHSRVPHSIAAALGLREDAGLSIEQVLTGFLQPRRLLLVLDNFEHVLPAAPLVSRLLRAAPRLSVLITSRALLHLSGEHDFPVPGMGNVASPEVTAAEALRTDAIRLFADRAQALSPTFEITDANAADVVALCRRLDGLPLAIELAAAGIRRDSPRSLLERMSQSGALQVLGRGFHDAEQRQQTLRATIAWSDTLLSAEERSLFRTMGIFTSGASLAAAAAVGGMPRETTLELLGSLVDKSLVQRRQGPRIEDRFAMLQTLREYALAELETAGALPEARRRHALHCLIVAERAVTGLRGPDQGRLVAELKADHEEMRTALEFLVATVQALEALRLATSLAPYWDIRGHWVEGHRWLSLALERAPAVPPSLEAAALQGLAVLDWCLGRLQEARAHHRRAADIYRAAGEDLLLGDVLYRAGLTELFLGDIAGHERVTVELEQVAARLGDARCQALAHSSRSFLAEELGQTDRAAAEADQALALIREVGDAYSYGFLSNFRSEVARLAGDLDLACAGYEEVIRVGEQLGCRRFQIIGHGNLGQVFAAQGNWAAALRQLKVSLQGNLALGERRNLPAALINVAETLLHLENAELGARMLGAADALLAGVPMHYAASDRVPHERTRRAFAESLPAERLEALRREGATLGAAEVILRAMAFEPAALPQPGARP
jgi:predicted ATPase/serine/threonine protein kinase